MARNALQSQDYVWIVAVPKRQEFTEPRFHFGERVKWWIEINQQDQQWQTGRITGMRFTETGWHYLIQTDGDTEPLTNTSLKNGVAEWNLQLVKDSASVRGSLKPESEWLPTEQAAYRLGLSAEQLRKLRRKGLFRNGYHYRDTSVPGSGLPRWQWHVERCGDALALPPEKRPERKK